MKTLWSLLAKVLLVVAIVQGWFLYSYYQKNQQLMAENVQIETELLATKDALLAAEEKAAELEKQSLEGMLKETNKAVVSGWEKLLNAVEDELNKARESIEELGSDNAIEDGSQLSPSDTELSIQKQENLTEEGLPEESLQQQPPTENPNSEEGEEIPSVPVIKDPEQGERT